MAETKHADISPQQVLADSAKFTSEPQGYNAEEVVVVGCINGTPAPTQPCRVTLELSTDEVEWVRGDNKQFGPVEHSLNLAAFVLSAYAATGAWRHWRLAFGGNVGGPVAIAASTGEAPVLVPPEPPPLEGVVVKKGHEKDEPHKGQHGHPEKK